MRAYEAFLNGKRLCVAGIGKDGYLSAVITYRSDPNDTCIQITGLVKRKNLYVRWATTGLRAGDEVLIKIVDRKSVDKYKVVRRNTWKKDIESLKRSVRRQAKSFGWEVLEKRKAK